MATTVGIVGGIFSIAVVVLGLAFNMGKMASSLNRNTEMTTQVYKLVTDQDDRIQDLENNKLDKDTFTDFMADRFVPLETKHEAHHKE